mmetsp:Transcript_19422/g.47979  ORF Transcript_19422/g.47979 Transcript_19422/m.47979 type:complete len:92 (+) Transcript_19422:843-1118(+)
MSEICAQPTQDGYLDYAVKEVKNATMIVATVSVGRIVTAESCNSSKESWSTGGWAEVSTAALTSWSIPKDEVASEIFDGRVEMVSSDIMTT